VIPSDETSLVAFLDIQVSQLMSLMNLLETFFCAMQQLKADQISSFSYVQG